MNYTRNIYSSKRTEDMITNAVNYAEIKTSAPINPIQDSYLATKALE